MGRAEDLFARIEAQGIAAIDELIASAAAEELFLDFKGTSDSSPNGTLNEDDSKNLAKAISGFGNSEGGVVIWGVDCRPAQRGGGLQTLAKAPLAHARGFRHKIETALSGMSVPAPAGVVNHDFQDGQGPHGYVATLIPKADFSPVRAIRGSQGYYVRAGDAFVAANHDTLAGMFGRKPLGKVYPQLTGSNVRPPSADRNTYFSAQFGLFNAGVIVVERPYISIHPLTEIAQRCVCAVPDPPRWDTARSKTGNWSAYAHEGVGLVPGALLEFGSLTLGFSAAATGDFKAMVTLGAANTLPCRFEIECSAKQLNDAMAAAAGGRQIMTSEVFGFDQIASLMGNPSRS